LALAAGIRTNLLAPKERRQQELVVTDVYAEIVADVDRCCR
jgi:hypothetical protein